jgi:hypothetical protein
VGFNIEFGEIFRIAIEPCKRSFIVSSVAKSMGSETASAGRNRAHWSAEAVLERRFEPATVQSVALK